MLFETLGDRQNPAILFFHAMGVTRREQQTGGAVFERLLFLYFTDLHGLL